uniref:Protein atonal homolog 7-A-like n=1 Tax=Dermatophagoides pteronyssinus TaxID=6956 RepID=A0A6P6XYW9_DERPT|nr:protein atonal homolog 7-A-like [Dermatophagoides pteronyssinus]
MDHHQTLKHHSNTEEVSYVHDSIDMDWNIQCDLSNPESSSTSSEKRQTNHHRQSSGTLKSKSTYKHIPHREKPVHLVAKRNARERKRVQAVNMAFMRLRRCVPVENRTKRLSKVKTLHRAIEYIAALDSILKQDQISNATKDNIINENDQCSFRSSLRPATMIINDDDKDQDQCIMLNPQSNNRILRDSQNLSKDL